MPPAKFSSIIALEDNNTETFMICTEVIVRIARNILKEPNNPKYRSISLGSNVVTNKLLPASGAMQCLFEMGFQEGSDKLILPSGCSLECVKHIHDELLKRREIRRSKHHDAARKIERHVPLPPVVTEVTGYLASQNNELFNDFVRNIRKIWECESIPVQLKALKCVPWPDLKKKVEKNIRIIKMAIKKKEIEDQTIDCQELLLLELCKWFKFNFFQWVNKPECTKCGNKEPIFMERTACTVDGASEAEYYNCSTCNETVMFPRITNPEKLLETRRGRCGEWAHCFYLICRSIGWDVRYVLDVTDHVWVEVYSNIKKKWIHCDPCEALVDGPLVYECGWKKNLSYIIAFSTEEIQDVTWRYSCNYSKVLKNRKKCSEEQLVDVICNVRRILLSRASDKRREFIMKRAALELVELLFQKSPTDAEKQGRTSGSLAWRLARGEVSEEFEPFVWVPGREARNSMKLTLSYCCASDEYIQDDENVIKGWRNGLYNVDNISRKEESDWKMVYLSRKEGSDRGTLTWRFEVDDFAIEDVQVKVMSKVFESGKVMCRLCDDKTCVNVPTCEAFTTTNFKGSKRLDLTVELSGGAGDVAWQHAQLFRQSLNGYEKTFEITINLTGK